MVVKVFIKRRFKKGKEKEGHALIRKMRTRAMNQKGYISGETLINEDDAKITVVIGAWQSMEDWLNWKNEPRRRECDVRLEKLLECPSENEVYSHGFRPERIMVVK